MKKILFFVLLILFSIPLYPKSQPIEDSQGWKKDWAVKEGFSISLDVDGFEFPSAIAFVPNPGNGPKDPLYFVTELRGQVKVVTNDRSVYVFAEDFIDNYVPNKELPEPAGQGGIAGICLEPEDGYVFITLIYLNQNNRLRNNIYRFQSTPWTFSISPSEHVEFGEIFLGDRATPAHQIGGCQIYQNTLVVGVGDAHRPISARSLDSILGKVIRIDFDGNAFPDNPFYDPENPEATAGYIFAYGFRNPFGLDIVNDQLYSMENGDNVDRFLRIDEGKDYLWNGSDWGIGANALAVFAPSISPVQLQYYGGENNLFPNSYNGVFFSAVSGNLNPGYSGLETKERGILIIDYDVDEGRVVSVPEYLLRYQNNQVQAVAGLAFGPDGLYFSPLFPSSDGTAGIYKIQFDPNNQHPYLLNYSNPQLLLIDKGCLGCHKIGNKGGDVGPSLDPPELTKRLTARLNSEVYLEWLDEVDAFSDEPMISFTEARQEIREAEGIEKVHLWLHYHILEPNFDNPYAQMPYLDLSEAEIDTLVNFLLVEEEVKDTASETSVSTDVDEDENGTPFSIIGYLKELVYPLPPLRYRHVPLIFLFGFSLGILMYRIYLHRKSTTTN